MDGRRHGMLYAGPYGNNGGIEIVCVCGARKSQWGGILPSPGELLAEHLREAAQMQIDYEDGRWCGQCRWGVVDDPPCCTQPPPAAVGVPADQERNEQ